MDGVEMMTSVDDVYEMDCPQFVDFSAPQNVDDNADEWFNFDHENGVPIAFDEAAASLEASAVHQPPRDITGDGHCEDHATEMESSEPAVIAVSKQQSLLPSHSQTLAPSSDNQEIAEVSASSVENKSEVPSPGSTDRQVSESKETAGESSGPELTEPEDAQTSSGSEGASSAEMTTDSLESHKTDFDHENGVPIAFDEAAASLEASAVHQPPRDITGDGHCEDHATKMESSEPAVIAVSKQQSLLPSHSQTLAPSSDNQEIAEVSASSVEDKSEVPSPGSTDHQVSESEETAGESSGPKLTEPEDAQTSSGSEGASSAEMTTDSLESHKTDRVSDDQDSGKSTHTKPKTHGSPEMPVPKRRGNIVTSFSPSVDHNNTTSVPNRTSRPDQKKPVSQQRSVGAAVRKSPRLQTRRSADTARPKRRSSLLQATKRRSANAAMARPRSGSVDQPTNKRRKMGNEKPAAGPQTDAKKPCPKIKEKINLTIPTTPTLLKRNMAKPNVHLKTTEELEIDRIAQFRNNLAEIRKKSAQSFKAVKESGPVVPVHTTVKPTRVEEFKFETDSRIKSHPMETRKDAERKDFVGNLRKYTPSPSKHHGHTTPKPFMFSDSRKRSHEESFALEKKGYEFRSTALAVSQFQTKTPERFRSRPVSEQNKGPEPACDKPKKSKLTHPMTPALETRNRHRPITAISNAQREEMEVAEMKSFKFKARPVDPRVMSNVSIGVKTASHKETTKPVGFDLEIDKRLLEREAKREHSPERYEFRARPLPAKMLAGPVGIAEARSVPATVPKSPAFALKNRVKVHEEKEREKEKEKESEHDNSHIIKARPILHVGVPFLPNILHKKTEPAPFSFDEKIQESKDRKEARKLEIFREEEKARQFRAQPLPDPSCSGIPEKKVRPNTQSAAFNVADKAAKQAEDWSKKMEEEIRECKRIAGAFKAKPANILYEEPFVPEKSNKPMTDISNFTLNTEKRAEDRKGYEQTKHERQCAQEASLAQREVEKEEELRLAIARQRAEAVHRANPVRQYKAVAVLPSTKLPTLPLTPKFSDRTRRSSHV